MNELPSHNLGGLDIDLARRIDDVCRRFEADLRQGRQPGIEDYMVDVQDERLLALRAKLEALERELRQSEEASPETSLREEKLNRPASFRRLRLLGR